MFLLHWPNWFEIQEVKGCPESGKLLATNECLMFVKAQVSKAKHYAEHPQELVFEDNINDDGIEKEHQPDCLMYMQAITRDMRV